MLTDSDQDVLVEKLDEILADYDLTPGKKGRLIVQLLRSSPARTAATASSARLIQSRRTVSAAG